MKKSLHKFYGISTIAAFVLFCADMLILRLTNVDVAGTRLFVTYWKEIVLFAALVVVCHVLYERTGR